MPRQILIVDDIRSNREILKNILGEEYRISEATNGLEAITAMSRDYKQLSAVLLDLGMPVMDGFEVLARMRESRELSQLPVIVMTGQTDSDSEEKALKLGAKDYISKPYKSAIIKQRIMNTINLRETAATVNALRRDRLTGLYSREAFFEQVQAAVAEKKPGAYIMACFDIDSFKVINDQYGTRKGDGVLCYVADIFLRFFEPRGGICCRMMADNFAVLYPAALLGTAELDAVRAKVTHVDGLPAPISFSIGRYRVDDLTLSPSAMYDRAALAESSIKGRYDKNIASYDETMRQFLLREQQIVTEMDAAIQNRQFEAWYQPQYNHSTGALIGAEALVRWRHPERGMISPGAFIPIFEKNGFIYELDKYIWEEVSATLRRWRDEGRAPLPVSVNISRYDLFKPDLCDVLSNLIKTYGIPVELLRLEITESAFSESTDTIVRVVKRLIDEGFTVEIDDFGSGYSSLNTLKSVPAQVVKLDMRFLEDGNDSMRGGNILESVVRMTKWLGMSVIAEGVEAEEQADFLKSIGCSYVQGYLYARPMPVKEYEAHCKSISKEERMLTIDTVKHMDNNAFWDPMSMSTLIFNSYVGAACIYEYSEGNIELLRATDKFASLFDCPEMTVDSLLRLDLAKYMDPASGPAANEKARNAIDAMEEVVCEFLFLNVPGCAREIYLKSTLRVIASAGPRRLLYCISDNITAQRQAEQSVRRVVKQLQAIMDNVNCGITAGVIRGDDIDFLLANDRYYEILGYTRLQYHDEVGNKAFNTIHPDDRPRVMELIHPILKTDAKLSIEYRALRRDGSVAWLRSNISMTSFEGIDERVQLSTYVDFTEEKQAAQDLLDNLPGGAALYEYDGEHIVSVHINKRYWELVNRAPVNYEYASVVTSVFPDDLPGIKREVTDAIREKRDISCDFRVRYGTDGYRAFHVVGRVVPRNNGKYAIYATYTPITDEALSIQQMLPIALEAMMATQTGYSFVKDKHHKFVCCSRAVAKMYGLQSEKEIVGKTDYDFFPREIADSFVADDDIVLATGESIIDQSDRRQDADGGYTYTVFSKYPLKDSQGNAIGVYVVSRDTTKEHEAQSRLELLTNNIPGGIAIFESPARAPRAFRTVYFTDGLCGLMGYSREEYAAHTDRDAFHHVLPEDLPTLLAQIDALFQDGAPIDCIYRVRAKDRSVKYLNMKAVPGEARKDTLALNAVMFDVTRRQEALERLRMSEEENRLAVQQSKCVLCRYNIADKTLAISPNVNPIFNVSPLLENVPESQVASGRISPETAQTYTDFYGAIARGEPNGDIVFQRTSSSGWRWIEAHFTNIFASNGKPMSAVITYTDVTENVEKDAAYRKWQQSLENKASGSYSLFRCNVSRDTVVDSSEGNLLKLNFKSGPFRFDDHTMQYVSSYVCEEDTEKFSSFLNVDHLLALYYQGSRAATMEYREKQEKGGVRWLRLTVDLVEHPRSSDVEAYLLFEDIDAAKRAELKMLERAETDPLTGVLNREAFSVLVNACLRDAKPNTQHALFMLDIDGFKMVNDAFGHAAGDQTLVEVAGTLRASLRRNDLVGRLGGDEFVIFMPDVPGDAIVASKAKQICAATRKSLSIEVEISSSIGIAISPRDGSNFEKLYKMADSALYYVKGSGKDNYAFYHSDMAEENMVLEVSAAAKSGEHAKKKRRMLIVDDSMIDHAFLSHLFAEDFIVEKAKDGASALVRMRHYGSAISVVLLDLMMPGLDGFAVLDRMRQNADMRNIPVIVVSGDENRDTSLRAIRAGAVDFVTKPVDPDILRIRVQSAISKAENERLRAKNNFLEYQSNEVARYKTVLERVGTVVIENNWIDGSFTYDPSIISCLAGTYDNRKFWHILLADFVTDTETVKKMQELEHGIASDRQRMDGSMLALLKTPSKARHWFRFSVYKVVNEFGLAEKIYLTLNDLGSVKPLGQSS